MAYNDTTRLLALTPDIADYIDAADKILASFDFSSTGVIIFGPGFPVWLAVQVAIFGKSPVILTIINIIFASLGSALLTAFAYKITKNRILSLIAGLLNAISFLAISLSCMLLSDALFFTVILAGLLIFAGGLESNRMARFVIAGLIFGVATLMRSVSQLFYVVLILYAIIYYHNQVGMHLGLLFKRLWRPAATVLIMILVIAGWSFRNQLTLGHSQTALSGYGGLKALTVLARADLNNSEYSKELGLYVDQLNAARDAAADTAGEEYVFTRFVRKSFDEIALNHPLVVAGAWAKNVISNINDEWGVHYWFFPAWEQKLRNITSWCDKKGLNYRVSLISLIGLFIFLRMRKYRAVLILCTIYCYFAFIAGFSVWQGARIFYPGQIAQNILMAAALIKLYEFLAARLRTLGHWHNHR